MSTGIKVFFVLSLSLFLPIQTNAAIFTDNFDSEVYTTANWDILINSWDHVSLGGADLGYHGYNNVEGNPAAASFANNQQYYEQANLTVDSLMRLEGNEADQKNISAGLLFISGSVQSSDYLEYTILLEIDYEDDPNNPDRKLNIWSNSITPSGTSETLVGSTSVSITFDTFYSLRVSTDAQGKISVELYEANSSSYLGGLSGVSLVTPFNSGMIGLAAIDEATFNDFSITGNAVPIPGAVWLLGSSLVGLIGLRKKIQK